VDSAGFGSFGFSGPVSSEGIQKPARPTTPQKLSVSGKNLRQTPERAQNLRNAEAARQKGIATAKASVKTAEKLLIDARARAKRLEAAEKKARVELQQAEKQTREAEKRFKSASVVSEKAAERARSMAEELKEA